MKRFFDFFKDKLVFTLGFTVITIVFSIFFLSIPQSNSFPLLILLTAILIYIAVMGVEYYKYIKFIKELIELHKNPEYLIKAYSTEQYFCLEMIDVIKKQTHKELKNEKEQYTLMKDIINKWGVIQKQTSTQLLETANSVTKLSITRDVQEPLEDIKYYSDKLLNDVKMLSELTKLDEISQIKEMDKYNLVDQVSYIIESNKKSFSYNGVITDNKIIEEEVYVTTDIKWNGLMLKHILSNAVKFSCLKGESNIISFDIIEKEHDIILEICDKGIGIVEEEINEVFEPFFTGTNGSLYPDSSGLGLYISKCIADGLGHRIEIESEPEKGTKVSIIYNCM